MEDNYNENDIQSILDEFISPSDQPLIDAAEYSIKSIAIIKEIFNDRNNKKATSCFVFAAIASFIEAVSNIKVKPEKLIEFLAISAKEMGEE